VLLYHSNTNHYVRCAEHQLLYKSNSSKKTLFWNL